ncbi:hypothetical protein [Roseibium sp. RKSG952]|uniref:hypothetical protein n=1 Tax=Roseibium sp. RKSG952 TaxID=2529384 RepID=UPI0012BB572A|nr:hypothetical protein [Roseibium sp. RKSG952]MTH96933.1 hypothetical protein [Roseibium sp. RKSG952]
MKITVHILISPFGETSERLEQGFEIRKQEFAKKWGFHGYENYPTKHDQIPGTRFLVFSQLNSRGEDVILGTRRITPGNRSHYGALQPGKLAFEQKYKIDHNALPAKLRARLAGKTHFDIRDILPGAIRSPKLNYAEIGGFAIDTHLAHQLFETKSAYLAARNAIYEKTIEVAKDMGVDFVISVAQEKTCSSKRHG